MIDFKVINDARSGEEVLEIGLAGPLLLDCPILNKGSAFSEQERREFGLLGLLPPHVNTLEMQVARRYQEYQQKQTDLDRHIFLRALQDRNETLFYRLVREHITEMMPVIYTPVVGAACQHFSHIYRRPRGLFISYPLGNEIATILDNRPFREVDVIVVTDGERILGLGDQGVGGMAIPIGKLSLYTLCGGIHPARTLPILLDAGTDNPERLHDPLYLGWRHERVRGQEYDAFIEAFIEAVVGKFPNVLLQWEDFAQQNARRLLDRYRNRLCSFNDDIQGTAAVTLAGVLSAVQATRSPLSQQRIIIVGAGSAGTGIADLMVTAMVQEGLSSAAARSRFWLIDRQGMLHSGMDGLEPFQLPYAQPLEKTAGWQWDKSGPITFLDVVKNIHPTVLIGTSGQPGVFTEAVVREMARQVERPIIFPLSNPTSRCEAMPAHLLEWTRGRALVATGSPIAEVSYGGRGIPIGQCNNSYIFPGMGLGLIATGARWVTDAMFLAAARALADCSPARGDPDAPLFPPLEDIRQVSRRIALAVAAEAKGQGLTGRTGVVDLESLVDEMRWEPRYQPMKRPKT